MTKICCSTGTSDIKAFSLKLKLLKHSHFCRLFGFDFNFLQFPWVKFSDMLKPGRVWQEETFKIEKNRECQGRFFVFSIFVFFWLSENLVLQFFQIN